MKNLILLLLFFVIVECNAQSTSPLDSMLNKLYQSTNEDKARVDLLIQISMKYYGVNPTKMIEYTQKGIDLSQKLNYNKGLMNGNRFQGSAYFSIGSFKDAENSFIKSLAIAEEINDIPTMFASISNLGTVYNIQNSYQNALKYYQKAIKIGVNANMDEATGITYGNIGVIYSQLKDYKQALKYFQSGLDNHTKINYKLGIASGLANIGNVYFELKDYDKALDYYSQAQIKNIEINNKSSIAREYGNIANVYQELKKYEKAFEFHKKALDLNTELKNKKGIAVSMQGIGKYQIEQNNLTEALDYTQKANKLAQEIKVLDIQKETYDNLSVIFEKLNQKDSAFYYYKNYITVRDSIDNEANRKQISRLEIQYEFDSKEEKYKMQELLSVEKLSQQQLTLQLNQVKLSASNKDRDLIRLNYLKSQTELKSEQLIKNAQKKQLTIAEREKELNQKEIKIANLSLAAKEKQKWFYLFGISLLGIIGSLLFYQSRKRKKTNEKLQVLNNELDQANKIKTRFFGILNHDLRSPVANLIHFLHLQKDSPELLDEATKQRMQAKTITGAEDLLASMEDILLWSKGQMESFQPVPKNITVNQLFEDTKKVFSGYQSIQFNYQNPDNIEIFTDENYLKTIIRNLTSNAINVFTTTTNPQITWRAWQENGKKYLSITDNGAGGTKEQFKALYDDKEVVGIKTGLGLHLIRDLAKAIDCTIDVESKVNIGTTITLGI
jgi:signal transduction histidine kinase/tetratricopeptide (TPR) repeat protein